MSRQIRFNGAAGGLRDGEFYLDDDSLTNPESHCMTTMNTPHRVVRAASGDDVENEIYFIAQLPLGSYVVHCWSSNDASGYCGSELTFLTEDGSFETVKGPYEMSNWLAGLQQTGDVDSASAAVQRSMQDCSGDCPAGWLRPQPR